MIFQERQPPNNLFAGLVQFAVDLLGDPVEHVVSESLVDGSLFGEQAAAHGGLGPHPLGLGLHPASCLTWGSPAGRGVNREAVENTLK